MDNVFKEIKDMFDIKFRNVLQKEIQGYKYHHEGDVYTHTMMVVKEAYDYEGYSSDKERNIFITAAFCHDLGKAWTGMLLENGKLIHQGHSGVSVFYGLEFLFKVAQILNFSIEDIIRILYIVNYHDAHYEMPNFTTMISYHRKLYDDLKLFAKFDLNGRIMMNKKKYDKYPEFIPADTETEKNRQTDKTVVLLIGIPNSGKDTYLRENNIKPDAIVSRDDTLMEYGKKKYGDYQYTEMWNRLTKEDQENITNLTWKKYQNLLKDKTVDKIYINLTNTSFSSRRKWLNVKNRFNCNFKYVVFIQDLQEIFRRNIKRTRLEGKHIPEQVLIDMMKAFRMPVPEFESEFIERDIEFITGKERTVLDLNSLKE